MAETFTRQQLHDLVWSAPMREVAKRLGLSDVGLRKHCVKSFVPPPPQGYWNKVHAGQTDKVVPLPPRPPGIPDEISIGQEDYRTYNQRLLAKEPVPPVFDETVENLRARVARNIGIVVASKTSIRPTSPSGASLKTMRDVSSHDPRGIPQSLRLRSSSDGFESCKGCFMAWPGLTV